ncbi:MAG: Uma2 family endonuclease [Bacteroidota bacterium]
MIAFDIPTKYYTIAEYLEMEDASDTRHEFDNGTITEMAGGKLPHNTVKLEALTIANLAIRKAKVPHMALNSDTKVRIEATNKFVYPDGSISDGTPEYYVTPNGTIRRDVIVNPLVIFEVLSNDTRGYDKTDKFDLYCTIPGFREYVLIEPEKIWVKQFFLEDPANNLWRHELLTDRNATLLLRSINLEIPLEEIYAVLDKLPK